MSQKPTHVHGFIPPRPTALLGHGWHTRFAAEPLTYTLLAAHVQVRALAPDTLLAGQDRHGLPLTTLYVLAAHGGKQIASTPLPAIE
jgi:hypothetical protein